MLPAKFALLTWWRIGPCIILSGDQLFRMNLNHFVTEHLEAGADISIAAFPCH